MITYSRLWSVPKCKRQEREDGRSTEQRSSKKLDASRLQNVEQIPRPGARRTRIVAPCKAKVIIRFIPTSASVLTCHLVGKIVNRNASPWVSPQSSETLSFPQFAASASKCEPQVSSECSEESHGSNPAQGSARKAWALDRNLLFGALYRCYSGHLSSICPPLI